MKIKYRCLNCNKVISKDRHYCYGCFTEAEDKVNKNE
jgi:rRNA maturation endonuclease Nob1